MALTTEDRLEIHELVARYNRFVDSGAVEDWVNVFTRDGAFQNRSGQRWVGHDQLRAFIQAYAADPQVRGNEHWANNIILEEDQDEVRLFCHGMIVQEKDGAVRIRSMSSYQDRVRKEDGRWKFALRRVVVWATQPQAETQAEEGMAR